MIFALTLNLLRERHTVERLDHRNFIDNLTDLVCLQMSDEMNVHAVFFIIIILGQQFLRPIFTKQPHAGMDGLIHTLRLNCFCHGHQLHIRSVATT